MLGYVNISGRGKMDNLLLALAQDLKAHGVRVAGAVQRNVPDKTDTICAMELQILTGQRTIRISQPLGAHARGCRLDPQALADAVGEVEASLITATPPDLLILNKFGNQEAVGGGFRSAISTALLCDIPTVIGVPDSTLAAFQDWAGDMAQPVAAAQIHDWCAQVIGITSRE